MKFTFQPESRPLDGYTLKRGIARGGFGEVYYALSDAGKEVAVKLLQHNLDVELRGVQQCLNLRHPHLVTIFDVKTDSDNDHWVVMEYIGGQTLEQALQTQPGPLPVDQIEKWLTGLASGLSYLHDRGIVHRDIKPGNVFWDQGSVKIGDIGLSKFMTPSRRSAHTESVGTVYYMAPEVTYGKYGYEVDIYSTGVMLYEMLTGKLPFDGQSTGEILMKHLSEPPDLSIVAAQFRPMLISALEKDPKKRTGSMQKLMEDFQQARRGGPVRAAETRPSGFAKWIPPSNLPEPNPIPGGPAVAGAIPAAQALPHPGQYQPTLTAGVSSNSDWMTRTGLLVACLVVPFSLLRMSAGAHGTNPFTALLYWPVLFAALRLLPLVRTAEGYRPISLESLIGFLDRDRFVGGLLRRVVCRNSSLSRLLESDHFLGKVVQEFRSWTQSPVGYWVAWMGLYLCIQLPLFVFVEAFEFQKDTGQLEGLFFLMSVVYAIPVILKRPRLESVESIDERYRPVMDGVGRTIPPATAPAAQDVGRGRKVGNQPAPPPLPAGARYNLRLAELMRSLNWATVLTVVFGLGTGFLSPLFGTPTSLHPDLGKLGLFVITTLLGVWGVLISAKLTEDSKGFGRHKKLIGMLTGVVVGSAAWWLNQVLLVDVSVNLNMRSDALFDVLGRQPLTLNDKPTWLAYSVFFGALFGLRRWWWHVDPFRPALFRISSVLLTVALAAVLPKVFLFPWDWAVTWAAVMSCVVQLSAAWVPLEERVRKVS